ncbi:MAG: ABC transporter ATP-binding protein [Candidatus Hodarchaeales archaeon]|jgi:putative ABC transport system ATP-binding protein
MTFNEYTIETRDVEKTYFLEGGIISVPALRGITMRVQRGEYVSIMGPSGSGKTTLFNIIGGLDKPETGKVYIDEVDISKLDAYELAWLRARKIGYIFQMYNLLPVLSAIENLELPMIFTGTPREERRKKATELLSLVGLGGRLDHKPAELSGGQQQRVAIARSLANDPTIILADEPTGNLDLETGLEIIKLLKDLNRDRGTTVVTATHDLKMIDVSDRVIWIRNGKVERDESRVDIQVTAIS